jgi:predicted Zn-dependent protease
VPRPKPKDANLEKGLKYFKAKRWDLTIKYLNIYLKKYPEDKEIQNKLKEAKENANKAIALYKSGKSAERAGNFAEAYRLYKNSYNLYPLLYDTWERMKAMQRKL